MSPVTKADAIRSTSYQLGPSHHAKTSLTHSLCPHMGYIFHHSRGRTRTIFCILHFCRRLQRGIADTPGSHILGWMLTTMLWWIQQSIPRGTAGSSGTTPERLVVGAPQCARPLSSNVIILILNHHYTAHFLSHAKYPKHPASILSIIHIHSHFTTRQPSRDQKMRRVLYDHYDPKHKKVINHYLIVTLS